MKKKTYYKLKVINIGKEPNWFGMLGLRIARFGGWLYDVTGNEFTKEDYKKYKKTLKE